MEKAKKKRIRVRTFAEICILFFLLTLVTATILIVNIKEMGKIEGTGKEIISCIQDIVGVVGFGAYFIIFVLMVVCVIRLITGQKKAQCSEEDKMMNALFDIQEKGKKEKKKLTEQKNDIKKYIYNYNKPKYKERKKSRKERQDDNIENFHLSLISQKAYYRIYTTLNSALGVIGTIIFTGNLVSATQEIKMISTLLFFGGMIFVSGLARLALFEYPKLCLLMEIDGEIYNLKHM